MRSVPSGLVCPSCQCPILADSSLTRGMHCPRCNHWLDLEPSCAGGSCFSCLAKEEKSSACGVANSQMDSLSEKSTAYGVQIKRVDWIADSGPIITLRRLCKDIYYKIFN